MAVDRKQIAEGAVFRFKVGLRQVVSISGDNVVWAWADSNATTSVKPGGVMWIKCFCEDAIERVSGQQRRLLTGEVVNVSDAPIALNLRSLCPEKYLVMDLETGVALNYSAGALVRADTKRVRAAYEVMAQIIKGQGGDEHEVDR